MKEIKIELTENEQKSDNIKLLWLKTVNCNDINDKEKIKKKIPNTQSFRRKKKKKVKKFKTPKIKDNELFSKRTINSSTKTNKLKRKRSPNIENENKNSNDERPFKRIKLSKNLNNNNNNNNNNNKNEMELLKKKEDELLFEMNKINAKLQTKNDKLPQFSSDELTQLVEKWLVASQVCNLS